MDKQKEKTAIERLRAFVPEDGEPVFRWWIGDEADPNQLSFFEEEEE